MVKTIIRNSGATTPIKSVERHDQRQLVNSMDKMSISWTKNDGRLCVNGKPGVVLLCNIMQINILQRCGIEMNINQCIKRETTHDGGSLLPIEQHLPASRGKLTIRKTGG